MLRGRGGRHKLRVQAKPSQSVSGGVFTSSIVLLGAAYGPRAIVLLGAAYGPPAIVLLGAA